MSKIIVEKDSITTIVGATKVIVTPTKVVTTVQ